MIHCSFPKVMVVVFTFSHFSSEDSTRKINGAQCCRSDCVSQGGLVKKNSHNLLLLIFDLIFEMF